MKATIPAIRTTVSPPPTAICGTPRLVTYLIAVIAVTKLNAMPLEGLLAALNAPQQMTGFLVALLILSPEGLGA